MRSRRLVVLAVVFLVAATLVAIEPVRAWVWDWMTTRTVERVDRHGVRHVSRFRIWDRNARVGPVRVYYPNGQLWVSRHRPVQGPGFVKCWTPEGELLGVLLLRDNRSWRGVLPTWHSQGCVADDPRAPLRSQNRYVDGAVVEVHTSTPWFTEEEILQSLEGIRE